MAGVVKAGVGQRDRFSKVMPGRDWGQGYRWGGAMIAALLVLGGCEGQVLPDPLPPDVLAYLEPAGLRSEVVAQGLAYHAVESSHEPWSLHLLEVSMDACALGFRVVGLDPRGSERQTVSSLFAASGSGRLAAVNGDFFTPENEPIGVEVTQGAVQGGAARPAFAWRADRGPRLTPIAWRGDTLHVEDGWSLVRGEPDGQTELIAGFPALLRAGDWVGDLEGEARPAFSLARHPRTALGIDPVRNRLWIVVVDGRREGVSEGMTLPELASLFQALGATEALNLDGGGSSTMVIRGRVVSRPSDPLGPRPVVNALTVLEDPSLCAIPER